MAWSVADLAGVARVTSIASSGIFAGKEQIYGCMISYTNLVMQGYTWSLSDAAVPAILAAKDEVTMADQWRIQYVRGFIVRHLGLLRYSFAPEVRILELIEAACSPRHDHQYPELGHSCLWRYVIVLSLITHMERLRLM